MPTIRGSWQMEVCEWQDPHPCVMCAPFQRSAQARFAHGSRMVRAWFAHGSCCTCGDLLAFFMKLHGLRGFACFLNETGWIMQDSFFSYAKLHGLCMDLLVFCMKLHGLCMDLFDFLCEVAWIMHGSV